MYKRKVGFVGGFSRTVFCFFVLSLLFFGLPGQGEVFPPLFLVTDGNSHDGLLEFLQSIGINPAKHDLKNGPIPTEILFKHVKGVTILALGPQTKLSENDQNNLLDYFTSRGNCLLLGKDVVSCHDHTEFLNYFLLTEFSGISVLPENVFLKCRVDSAWPDLELPKGEIPLVKPNDQQASVLFDVPELANQEPGFAIRGKT